jgi:ferric-dicitrate binding protein FerR (iron transport regulator)
VSDERTGPDSSEIDSATLARFLQGECDPTEAAAVRRWAAADLAHQREIDRLKAAFDRVTDDALWRGIAARIEGQPERPPVVGHVAPAAGAHRAVWRALGVAAAFLMAIGGTIIAARLVLRPSAQQFREFVSAPGSRTTIELRDGTRLVLGPATRLRVSSDFGRATRTVELDGEALFTVVHDAVHPFAVRTAHTTVRDVGTTFVVRAYAQDPDERVAVGEGEVALPGAELRARDVASVDVSGRVSVRRDVDVAPYLTWVQGGLVFQDTPLRDVVRELARTYDLEVTVADTALEGEVLSASFNGESADEVLGVITHIVGAHFTRSGRAVVIRRGAVPVGRPGAASDAAQRVARGGERR